MMPPWMSRILRRTEFLKKSSKCTNFQVKAAAHFSLQREHTEEDDAALEKYHQAAIEGKYRGKRRGGGVAMDDSESDEDEDEEARMLRRRLHKKRRIAGDKLEDLSQCVPSSVYSCH